MRAGFRQLRHVDEFHFPSLGTKAFTQPVGMAAHHRDHDSLARSEPVFDEWCEDGGIVVSVAPHERFVPITLLRSWWCSLRHTVS
jgi:hypothetical protein